MMQQQVTILMLIRALRMFMITMPVIVLYWQSHGLGMKDIFILQVIFSVSVVLFEVPSGYFADRFGHRYSIIIGNVMGTLGFFCYWAFPSYLGFVLAEVILALGAGFISGARDALLYDTLEAHDASERYTKIQGRQLAIGNVSEAAAAIAAGIIAWYAGVDTVMLVQWLVIALAIPLSWRLKEIRSRHKERPAPLWHIVRNAMYTNKSLRYLNLIAGGISASTLTMVWFSQPHWESLGVPVLYFGYIWAALNLVAAMGSTIAHYLERYIPLTTLIGLLAATPLMLYLMMSITSLSIIAFAFIPFFWLLRGVSNPILQDYVQRTCTASERATVLSINALSSRLVFSIFSPFLGWVADVWSFGTAFMASALIYGSISLLAFLGFWLTSKKVSAI